MKSFLRNWNGSRRHAPADAHCPQTGQPQLDPVSVFEHFASHPSDSFRAALYRFTDYLERFGSSAGCSLADPGGIAARV